jgi:hypothetical protein
MFSFSSLGPGSRKQNFYCRGIYHLTGLRGFLGLTGKQEQTVPSPTPPFRISAVGEFSLSGWHWDCGFEPECRTSSPRDSPYHQHAPTGHASSK